MRLPATIVNRLPASGGTSLARKASSPVESRCEGTGLPSGPVDHVAGRCCMSFDSTTRSVRGQEDVLNTSTAAGGSASSPRPASAAGQQFPRLGVGVERERLLDLPLVLDERLVGLGDAVVGAPGVLVVEDHVAPGGGELLGGIAGRVEHRPEGFGLHEPLGGGAVEGGFAGRRGRPVLPVGRQIAAERGQLVAVPLLELAEHLRRRWR